jgi:hypothetical protein
LGNPAHKEREDRMDQQAKWGLLGLLGWLVLSVPVAVMVGKGIKAYQAQQEAEGRKAPLVRQGPRAIRDRPVNLVPKGVPVKRESQERQAPPALPVLPVLPEFQDPWDPWDQWGL